MHLELFTCKGVQYGSNLIIFASFLDSFSPQISGWFSSII